MDVVGRTWWVTRSGERAAAVANSIVDLLEDKTVGQNYDWDDHSSYKRHYIFGKRPDKDPEKEEAKGKKRKRVGHELAEGEFLWGRPTRPKETIPEALKKTLGITKPKPSNYSSSLSNESFRNSCEKCSEAWGFALSPMLTVQRNTIGLPART